MTNQPTIDRAGIIEAQQEAIFLGAELSDETRRTAWARFIVTALLLAFAAPQAGWAAAILWALCIASAILLLRSILRWRRLDSDVSHRQAQLNAFRAGGSK